MVICPQFNCGARVNSGQQLYNHYSSHHKQLVMSSKKFNVPRGVGTRWDKIIKECDNFYIFRMIIWMEDTVLISLEYIDGAYGKPPKFSLVFSISNSFNDFDMEHYYDILDYNNSVTPNCSKMITLNMEDIKEFLGHRNILVELIIDDPPHLNNLSYDLMPHTTVNVPRTTTNMSPKTTSNVSPSTSNAPRTTLNVQTTTSNGLNYPSPSKSTGAINKVTETTDVAKSIEGEFECPICNELMKSPIYLCATGHSICNKCKPKLQTCPFCKKSIGSGRNFALEKLSEYTDTLLKMGNFNIDDKNGKIGNNYKKIFSCPVSFFCNWLGNLDKMEPHITKEHKMKLCDFGAVFTDLNSDFSKKYFMYKFENQLFRFNLRNNSDNNYIFTLDHVTNSTSDKPQYMYSLHFTDQNNSNRILSVNAHCFKWCECSDQTKSCIYLHWIMLKPFINKNNSLHYDVRIKKITQQ